MEGYSTAKLFPDIFHYLKKYEDIGCCSQMEIYLLITMYTVI
jgi:hypothetical protein